MKNFISIFDNALTQNECIEIIQYFENNSNKTLGRTIKGETSEIVVDPLIKDSLDLHCKFTDNTVASQHLLACIEKYTKLYRKEYPDVDLVNTWGVCDYFNLQRYFPGQGYHNYHCEAGGKSTNHRILAWSFYLNTVTDGGQTRFPTYDLNIEAKMGRLVIWPAFFTHIHHGIISSTQIKYIATGWYVYDYSVDK